MNFIKRLFKKDAIGNRKVTRAKFLYVYVILGSMLGLGYFIASFPLELPGHWALSPLYGLVLFVALRFLKKNWSLIWLYIRDMEQGKLLLFLNDYTHWEEEHKMKVINWVYLRRGTVRQETKLRLADKISSSTEELTKEDKKVLKSRAVFCPQQIKDGFNEALLVNALIYAHINIQVLDDELRTIMNLTDENILAFDLNKEHDKCVDDKYQKMIEIGKRNSKNK